MFKVKTQAEAEEKMRAQDYEFEWIKVEDNTHDCVVKSKVLPAVRKGSNGNSVFFN